jgi:hypothetical protein
MQEHGKFFILINRIVLFRCRHKSRRIGKRVKNLYGPATVMWSAFYEPPVKREGEKCGEAKSGDLPEQG